KVRPGTVLRFRSSEAGTASVGFARIVRGRHGGIRLRRAGRLTRTVAAGRAQVFAEAAVSGGEFPQGYYTPEPVPPLPSPPEKRAAPAQAVAWVGSPLRASSASPSSKVSPIPSIA